MIGYPHCQKGYKLYDLEKKKMLVSRDIIFQDDIFPFLANKENGNHIDIIRNRMPLMNDA